MCMGVFLKETGRKEITWKKLVEVGRILLKWMGGDGLDYSSSGYEQVTMITKLWNS